MHHALVSAQASKVHHHHLDASRAGAAARPESLNLTHKSSCSRFRPHSITLSYTIHLLSLLEYLVYKSGVCIISVIFDILVDTYTPRIAQSYSF